MACTTCGTEQPRGAKFCVECGASLVSACASCGAVVPPAASSAPSADRRIDSAPARDPGIAATTRSPRAGSPACCSATWSASPRCRRAATRRRSASCCRRYFEECRAVVDRYGGTVEKFIGDAVMAVWGVPTAHEDDAERAVRAGLELVDAVAALGDDLGRRRSWRCGSASSPARWPSPSAPTQQGMVAGDAVNTAARVQSAAAPGPGVGRRDDPAAHRLGDHLRRRRQPRAEGQGRPGAAVVGARRGRRGRRRAAGRRARGAAGRPRPRAAAGQGAVPRGSRRPADRRCCVVDGEPGVGSPGWRWEFEKYVDGLTPVGRVAQRPLPVLRRGRRVLRARRGGPRPAAGARPRSRTTASRRPGRLLERGLAALRPRRRASGTGCGPRLGALLGRRLRSGRSRARTCSPRGPRSSSASAAATRAGGAGHRRRAARRRRPAAVPRAPARRRRPSRASWCC